MTGSGDEKTIPLEGKQQPRSTKLSPQKARGQNSARWAGLASAEGRGCKL